MPRPLARPRSRAIQSDRDLIASSTTNTKVRFPCPGLRSLLGLARRRSNASPSRWCRSTSSRASHRRLAPRRLRPSTSPNSGEITRLGVTPWSRRSDRSGDRHRHPRTDAHRPVRAPGSRRPPPITPSTSRRSRDCLPARPCRSMSAAAHGTPGVPRISLFPRRSGGRPRRWALLGRLRPQQSGPRRLLRRGCSPTISRSPRRLPVRGELSGSR